MQRPLFKKSFFWFLLPFFLNFAPPFIFASVDPAKVVGPEACGNCHRLEYDAWRKTKHYQLMDTLYKDPMAQQIAKRMGERLIKIDSVCLNCHFTPKIASGKLTATAGVSCESCHGNARDWIKIHNDYGGPQVTRQNETPEHRAQRIAAARAAGMNVPEQLYTLASNCYQCHTVQNEKLVNVGQHPTGSSFDLVERAKIIRHNFIRGDRKSNPEATPERKRMMYLVGWTLELEYGLRGAAKATEDGRYINAMKMRVKSAMNELRAIKEVMSIPEVDEALNAAQGLAIQPNSQVELTHAADRVASAGVQMAQNYDGKKFAKLDELMTGGGGTEGSSASTAASGASPSATGTHVRAASNFKTLPANSCGCHASQNDWWAKDKHFASADPFLNDDPKRIKIARLYGITPTQMKTGQAICMDCHATVVTGREKREVDSGVSCQNCHGPAGDYLNVHNEGKKFHPEAFQKGMRQLSDLKVRAETCAGCHYVTEPRLISAGHPSNSQFDYVAAMDKIKHWKEPNDAAAIKSAFAEVIAKRGPVPEVKMITEPPPLPPEESATGETPGKAGGAKAAPAGKAVQVGEKKSHILPRPQGKVIGPGNCSGCHQSQNQWWAKDKHNLSAEPFWNEESKNVQIAANYGISATDMKNGNNICMDCHGTVVTGKESREVSDGVGCENCHGPAGDYLKMHNVGNTFHPEAFQKGMRQLADLNVRAELCTGCHYITDIRLIASGHPTNANFDFVKAMARIQHWKAPNDNAALAAAFSKAIAKRGAIPKVDVPVAVVTSFAKGPEKPERVKELTPRPSLYQESGEPLNLPPFPEISPSASVQEILRVIKARIELLNQQLKEKK